MCADTALAYVGSDNMGSANFIFLLPNKVSYDTSLHQRGFLKCKDGSMLHEIWAIFECARTSRTLLQIACHKQGLRSSKQ
jgi:hypothetical protein